MEKKKVLVAYKDRTSQFNTATKKDNSTDVLGNYKRAMIAAIDSLKRGHTFEAEIYLKVGLLGANINDTNDIAEKIISWTFNTE